MSKLTDESQMPFGMHSHLTMEEVPADYLMWMWNEKEDDYRAGDLAPNMRDVMEYIEDNLDVLKKELE